jgi:hypothetical protein
MRFESRDDAGRGAKDEGRGRRCGPILQGVAPWVSSDWGRGGAAARDAAPAVEFIDASPGFLEGVDLGPLPARLILQRVAGSLGEDLVVGGELA